MSKKKTRDYSLDDDSSALVPASASSFLGTVEAEGDDNVVVLSRPPMIQPKNVPEGGFIQGILEAVQSSSKFKGQRVFILSNKNGQRVSFPCQKGLEIQMFPKGETESLDPMMDFNGKKISLIGKEIRIIKGKKLHSTEFKRDFSTWTVALVNPSKK